MIHQPDGGEGEIIPLGSPNLGQEPALSPGIPSLVSPGGGTGVGSTRRGGMKLLPLQVVKKSCYPRWNETFEFELAEPAGEKLCVEVWDWDLVGRNDFLGKVRPQTLSPLLGGGALPAARLTPFCLPLPGGVQCPGAGGGRAGGGLVQAAAGQVQAKGR